MDNMDKMKEISVEDLKQISGGVLSEGIKLFIDIYIEKVKEQGHKLEDELKKFNNNKELQDYMKEHW